MRSVVFDLDGTLVDSLPGIEHSFRHAVMRLMPERVIPDLRPLIGPPLATIFARIWPELEGRMIEDLITEFRLHYNERGCLETMAFPDVGEILPRLRGAGLRLFLLTNKPVVPRDRILRHLGFEGLFVEALSPDSTDPPLVSKTEGAVLLRDRYALDPAETVLVGDGAEDADAASACGFRFLAAVYGYGTGIRNPKDGMEKFADIEQFLL